MAFPNTPDGDVQRLIGFVWHAKTSTSTETMNALMRRMPDEVGERTPDSPMEYLSDVLLVSDAMGQINDLQCLEKALARCHPTHKRIFQIHAKTTKQIATTIRRYGDGISVKSFKQMALPEIAAGHVRAEHVLTDMCRQDIHGKVKKVCSQKPNGNLLRADEQAITTVGDKLRAVCGQKWLKDALDGNSKKLLGDMYQGCLNIFAFIGGLHPRTQLRMMFAGGDDITPKYGVPDDVRRQHIEEHCECFAECAHRPPTEIEHTNIMLVALTADLLATRIENMKNDQTIWNANQYLTA